MKTKLIVLALIILTATKVFSQENVKIYALCGLTSNKFKNESGSLMPSWITTQNHGLGVKFYERKAFAGVELSFGSGESNTDTVSTALFNNSVMAFGGYQIFSTSRISIEPAIGFGFSSNKGFNSQLIDDNSLFFKNNSALLASSISINFREHKQFYYALTGGRNIDFTPNSKEENLKTIEQFYFHLSAGVRLSK